MNEKEYELKDILGNKPLFDIWQYAVPKYKTGVNTMYGVDGMSLFGWNEGLVQSTDDVVEKLHNLADPEFVTVRQDWGVDAFGKENELADNICDYAKDQSNSFALKSHEERIGNLRFPLQSNYMAKGRNLLNYSMPTKLGKQIDNIEKKLNVAILSVPADFSSVEFQEQSGLFGKVKNFLSPVLRVSSKVFGKFLNTNKDFLDKYKIYNNKTAYFLLAEKMNGATLSDAEKVVAIVDTLSKTINEKVAKNHDSTRKYLKNHPESAKIIYASQLLTNINVALAHDLGVENHKQIDNALKLELANVMASFEDKDPAVVAMIGINAQTATETLLSQLGIKPSKIVEHRKALGISYIKEPTNIYDIMFGKTTNNRYYLSKKDKSMKYYGVSDLYESIAPGKDKTKSSAKTAPTPEPEPQSEPEQDKKEDEKSYMRIDDLGEKDEHKFEDYLNFADLIEEEQPQKQYMRIEDLIDDEPKEYFRLDKLLEEMEQEEIDKQDEQDHKAEDYLNLDNLIEDEEPQKTKGVKHTIGKRYNNSWDAKKRRLKHMHIDDNAFINNQTAPDKNKDTTQDADYVILGDNGSIDGVLNPISQSDAVVLPKDQDQQVNVEPVKNLNPPKDVIYLGPISEDDNKPKKRRPGVYDELIFESRTEAEKQDMSEEEKAIREISKSPLIDAVHQAKKTERKPKTKVENPFYNGLVEDYRDENGMGGTREEEEIVNMLIKKSLLNAVRGRARRKQQPVKTNKTVNKKKSPCDSKENGNITNPKDPKELARYKRLYQMSKGKEQ